MPYAMYKVILHKNECSWVALYAVQLLSVLPAAKHGDVEADQAVKHRVACHAVVSKRCETRHFRLNVRFQYRWIRPQDYPSEAQA